MHCIGLFQGTIVALPYSSLHVRAQNLRVNNLQLKYFEMLHVGSAKNETLGPI